jgi:lysophospholipase L1-like esterase
LDRRTFLRNTAVGAGAVTAAVETQAANRRPEAVAGYDYQKPSLAKQSRILFLGDSITDMKWGRNQRDRNHYLGHSYVYLIASRLGVDMPEAGLEFFNRGVSGNKVADLKLRWQRDAIDMKPDLLSILIGVNDVSRGGGKDVPLDRWETDYRFLLDRSRQASPDLRLVLLDPFVLRSGRLSDEQPWIRWRDQIDRLRAIVARLASDYAAVHIKTQDIFNAATATARPQHWIWDGVHPLPQGHELIARNWLQQVSDRWT